MVLCSFPMVPCGFPMVPCGSPIVLCCFPMVLCHGAASRHSPAQLCGMGAHGLRGRVSRLRWKHHLPSCSCALARRQPHPAPDTSAPARRQPHHPSDTCVPARQQPHLAEIRRWRRQSVQMGRKICVCLSSNSLWQPGKMRTNIVRCSIGRIPMLRVSKSGPGAPDC